MSKIVMDQGNDSTPNLYYAGCAFTYSVAMVASNKALQWVRLNFNYFLNRPNRPIICNVRRLAQNMYLDIKGDLELFVLYQN